MWLPVWQEMCFCVVFLQESRLYPVPLEIYWRMWLLRRRNLRETLWIKPRVRLVNTDYWSVMRFCQCSDMILCSLQKYPGKYESNCHYFCDQSWIQHHYSSVTWSSEIIIMMLMKHFWLISMLKTVVLHNIFVIYLFFRIHRWTERSKEQHLFQTEIFFSIIYIYVLPLLIHLMHPWWIKVFNFWQKKEKQRIL